MEYAYFIAPFIAWLVTGCCKFLLNSIKARRLAFDLIGYGGMPSNHAAIVSATTALIGFREGLDHPAFGVAITLAFIVILDASSLRAQVGKHAQAINQLNDRSDIQPLRERMGHTKPQIASGILLGIGVAWLLNLMLQSSAFS